VKTIELPFVDALGAVMVSLGAGLFRVLPLQNLHFGRRPLVAVQ
jgi:hypothetical protein